MAADGAKWTRRHLLVSGAGIVGAYALGLSTPDLLSLWKERKVDRALGAVLPEEPVDTGVSFGRAVAALAEAGAVDGDKFRRHYADRGGLPERVENALAGRP